MNDNKKMIEGVWQKVAEKERNIELANGLDRRNETDLFYVAKDFLSRMGFKRLLDGMADVITVSMLISIIIFICIYRLIGRNPESIYSLVFIFSPILYASVFILSYIKEVQTNTFKLQMSCRYTFYHVLIFRMTINSGLAIVFNLFYICTLNSKFEINLLKALALSFSSLMLFSVLLLKVLRHRRKVLGFSATSAIWFGINYWAFNSMRGLYMQMIDQIPLGVLLLAIFIFIILYYKELKSMLTMSYKRRYMNA